MADKEPLGLSISPDLHDRAMDGVPREINRSERLCALIEIGLQTEAVFEEAGLPSASEMHPREVRDTLRTAVEAAEFE